jgi:hypothetical protein
MSDYSTLCHVRCGSIRLGQVMSYYVRIGQAKSGYVRLGQFISGYIRLGLVSLA